MNAPEQSESGYRDQSYRLQVDDMTCGHCVVRVEQAALGAEGVERASVDLEQGTVEVSGGQPHRVVASTRFSAR